MDIVTRFSKGDKVYCFDDLSIQTGIVNDLSIGRYVDNHGQLVNTVTYDLVQPDGTNWYSIDECYLHGSVEDLLEWLKDGFKDK